MGSPLNLKQEGTEMKKLFLLIVALCFIATLAFGVDIKRENDLIRHIANKGEVIELSGDVVASFLKDVSTDGVIETRTYCTAFFAILGPGKVVPVGLSFITEVWNKTDPKRIVIQQVIVCDGFPLDNCLDGDHFSLIKRTLIEAPDGEVLSSTEESASEDMATTAFEKAFASWVLKTTGSIV